jgi:hypothetical protein
MNTTAQQGPISFTFMIIMTVIIFGLIGGQILGLFSLAAIMGNLTGFSLFIMSNFAVWIACGIILSIILYFWRAKK